MQIDYRIDHTKIKKKRGGSYIDHESIQCFTRNVRKDDIKRMYNYTKGSESYIFNIMNQNDNLCFIYYIILIKYLCEYNTLKHKVNPNEINLFIPYLPLINYPNTIINEEAKRIIEKHFPNGNTLESIRDGKYTRKYFNNCELFMNILNNSSFIPVNADNAELIKQFETLNNLTINIHHLDKDAYDEKGKKKLHDLWSAKYMTETKAKNMNQNNHLDLILNIK